MRRRPFAGALAAGGGVFTLIAGLAVVDNGIRQYIAHFFRGGASAEVTAAGFYLQGLTSVVMQAVRDQSLEHAPLIVFGLAAGVLTIFMLRT